MPGNPDQKHACLNKSVLEALGELMTLLSHELNQPLTAILGNAQAALRLMERGAPDLNEMRQILEDIVADDQRAAEMIGGIRSRLKIDIGGQEPVLLNDLIKEIVSGMQNDAQANDISIQVDLDSSLPLVNGNRAQLRQVVLNLIVNAFEAMEASAEQGKLILRTSRAGGDVVMDVVDSGIGIRTDKLASIFEPFVTTKAGGLGMGLALSRSMVMRHNGRLWAENNADGGATFHVALPVANSLQPAPTIGVDSNSRGDEAPRSGGLIVIIADDRESFRHAVSSLLTDLPNLHLLAEAADGAEAVRKAAELNPDLVLLDMGLPLVNGIEAAAQIRAIAPNARMLFLTQHDSPEFVTAAMRAGAAGYVLKVDVGRELLHAAMAVLRGEQYVSSSLRR